MVSIIGRDEAVTMQSQGELDLKEMAQWVQDYLNSKIFMTKWISA